MKNSPPKIDTLLNPMVRMREGEETDVFLSQLIAEHAEPVINGIIRYKLRHNLNRGDAGADVEDLRQEAIAQLLVELQKLRTDSEAHAIRDVRGLAATITYRLCAAWMRRQFPRQNARRNQIQYLLTRQTGFALWPYDQGEMKKLTAGFAIWKGQRPSAGAAGLGGLPQDEKFLKLLGGRSSDLRETLGAIFQYIGGPVAFDELTKTVAVLLQITDRQSESLDAFPDDSRAEFADRDADVAWRVEKRIFLERLWEELRQLPLQQRVALLLNLRDKFASG